MLEQCKTTSNDCFRDTPDLVCILTLGMTQFIVLGVEACDFLLSVRWSVFKHKASGARRIWEAATFLFWAWASIGQGLSPAFLQWWLAWGEDAFEGFEVVPRILRGLPSLGVRTLRTTLYIDSLSRSNCVGWRDGTCAA